MLIIAVINVWEKTNFHAFTMQYPNTFFCKLILKSIMFIYLKRCVTKNIKSKTIRNDQIDFLSVKDVNQICKTSFGVDYDS